MKFSKPLCILAGVTLMVVFASVLFSSAAWGQEGDSYNEFLRKNPGHFYVRIISYLRTQHNVGVQANSTVKEYAITNGADIGLSFVCLMLAMMILKCQKKFVLKSYLRFLIAFNIVWFLTLLLYSGVWAFLNLAIVRLRPDMRVPIVDGFGLAALLLGAGIYNWLIARNFELNFTGALKVLVVTHLLYFGFTFGMGYIPSKPTSTLGVIQGRLTIHQVVRNYLGEIGAMSSGVNWLKALRMRPFHM